MPEVFNIDREEKISKNVDATGKKWVIHFNRGTSLCHVRPEPDREDAVIPKILQGRWTKPSLVEPFIKQYVTATWDKADKADKDAERKRQAAREHSNAKKQTKETDEGKETGKG